MSSDIMLTCNNVNSGNTVRLKGALLTYTWNNLTRTTPLTGQFTLAETQVTGFENPKLVVSGYIDTNDLDSNIINQSLLQDFAKIEYQSADIDTAIYLTVSTGIVPTWLKNYNHSEDFVKVVIENFNMTVDAGDSEEGHFWRYTLTLVETA